MYSNFLIKVVLVVSENSKSEHNPGPVGLRLELTIAPDGMRADLRIIYNPHFIFSYYEALHLLEEQKVVFGINHEAIKRLEKEYKEYKETQEQQKTNPEEFEFNIQIARGYALVPPQDGKVEFFIKSPPPVVIDEDGRADFRNIQRFQTVDKSDLLAREHPAIPGRAGLNIYGKEVLPAEPATDLISIGKNVVKLAGTDPWQDYGARVHGIFVHNGTFIDINPELLIPGNVGLESGNVDYDGNVKIGRNIERGAKAHCLGDMKVGGMIESGDVRVGGSLLVSNGINAGREKLLHARGDLQAYYIDNSKVFVDGSIEVKRSINASEIICMSDLVVADKQSNICGGELYVFGSLSVASVGNRAETPTRIILGNHIKNIEILKRLRHDREIQQEKFLHAREELVKIKNYVTRMRGKIAVEKRLQFRDIAANYQRIKDSLTKCINKIEHLKKSL